MSRLLLLALCLCCIATTAFAQDVIVINEAIYDTVGHGHLDAGLN